MIEDKELEDDVKKLNTMPLHLGPFVLSNSKRTMNNLYTHLLTFRQMMFILQIKILYILKINIGIN